MRPTEPRKTRQKLRVCESDSCDTKLSKQDGHVCCVACLSPSHFDMPQNKNNCHICNGRCMGGVGAYRGFAQNGMVDGCMDAWMSVYSIFDHLKHIIIITIHQ